MASPPIQFWCVFVFKTATVNFNLFNTPIFYMLQSAEWSIYYLTFTVIIIIYWKLFFCCSSFDFFFWIFFQMEWCFNDLRNCKPLFLLKHFFSTNINCLFLHMEEMFLHIMREKSNKLTETCQSFSPPTYIQFFWTHFLAIHEEIVWI